MSPFGYCRPSSLADALALLAAGDRGTKILAGGQSLLPAIALGRTVPTRLIDLSRIPDLRYARRDQDSVVVGPLARHSDFVRMDTRLRLAAPLLAGAAPLIGSEAIRNCGTLLGSLAHAHPAGEWPAVAVALDAEVEVMSARGSRTVPARDFFVRAFQTALARDEILVEARFPVAPPRSAAAVRKLTYRHADFAIVGVAVQLSLGEGDLVADARIALYGAGATPIRARAAERAVLSERPESFGEAAHAAAQAADPVDDDAASASYRREMVLVFTRRALQAAYDRALANAHA